MTTIEFARRRAPMVLAVLVASCAIAACGSSSTSSTKTSSSGSASSTTTSTTGTGSSRFTKLQSCLKSHGVSLPTRRRGTGTGTTPGAGGPPSGGGGGGGFFGGGGGAGGGAGGGIAARNPKLAAALKACGANFGAGGGRRFQLSHTAITKYVTCVRQHGYNLPNPNFSGKGGVFPTNIRTNKQFQTASKACQSLLVPARPGGTPTTPSS